MTSLSLGADLYRDFIEARVPAATQRIWIATADLKNMHVRVARRFVPFVSVIASAVERGIGVRLLHAKEPGPRFRKDFDRFASLSRSDLFERALCPRVHLKSIMIDGER